MIDDVEDYEKHWQESVGLKDRAIGFATGAFALAGRAAARLVGSRFNPLSRGGRK